MPKPNLHARRQKEMKTERKKRQTRSSRFGETFHKESNRVFYFLSILKDLVKLFQEKPVGKKGKRKRVHEQSAFRER